MQSRILLRIFTLLLVLLPFAAESQSTNSDEDGYGMVCRAITVDANADRSVLYAAEQLQHFLQQSGIDLPVEKYNKRRHKKGTIHIGYLNLQPQNSYSMIGDGHRMLIAGSGPKGTLYAVYDFLEHFCGFRLYAPDAMKVPQISEVRIPIANITERPAFNYREVAYYYPNQSQLYADWHKVNTILDRESLFGLFVHSFKDLIPAKDYFDSHPEWFSMRDGKRLRDGQLCLSNSEVLDSLCARLTEVITNAPDREIWSVSPNDNYNVCQCPECLRCDSIYGGSTGTLLHFVNQVARRFPDKKISTLAYQYTRSAPREFKVVPDSNVVVMLCPIEAGREEAISTSLQEYEFRRDLDNWNQLTDNIFLWDYVVQFRNYWNPFPNLHVLQPNLQFFHNNGARMMFEQATGAHSKTSWMEPRCYLISKLMWNPRLDADSLLSDFCDGYFGEAGRYIKGIIDTMTAALVASGQRLDIYGYAIDGCEGYLAPERMKQYRTMMARAYAATSDSIVHKRLRFFELPLDFATVELAAGGAFFDELFPNGEMTDKIGQLNTMLNRMVDDLNGFGVSQMMEMGCTPDQYRETIARYLEKTFSYSNSYFRHVDLRKAPTAPYTCDGAQSLTDGAGGIMDYRYNWMGFYGDTMDAVISLGATDTVSRISMDFYFYPLSWIFLPKQIDYYISNDREHWQLIGRHTPENPEILATPMIKTFNTDLPTPIQASYVRVVATPLTEIPQWHRAAGKPAWIFTDEIIVESGVQKTNGAHSTIASNNHILPAFLSVGDTVALISPSYYCDTEKVNKAANIMRQWGLVPLIGPNVGCKSSQFAGTDRQRMDDLIWAYKHPDVKAIICNRGGYGTLHFVDKIKPELFSAHHKWLVGYSDITTLHSMITANGEMSIHGIMAGGIADCDGNSISVELLKNLLFGAIPQYHTPPHPYNIKGTGHGTLVGGNLFTYEPVAGTEYDITGNEDFILFIEEIQEDFHHIDRIINTLIKRGLMKNCRGVIVGDFADCAAELGYRSVEEMLHSYLKEYRIPVLCGFPAGHGTTNLPLIMGAPVTLKVTAQGGTIAFNINCRSKDVDTDKLTAE